MDIIKIITKQDIKELASSAYIVWHEWFESIIGKKQVDYMLDKFQSEKALTEQITKNGYEYYAIKKDNKIIAYTGLHPESDKMFLSKLYVLKDYRGQGLSSLLLEKVYSRARECRLNKVYLTVNRNNKNSIDIYLKKGFKVVKEQKADIGSGFVMDDFIMEKTLL